MCGSRVHARSSFQVVAAVSNCRESAPPTQGRAARGIAYEEYTDPRYLDRVAAAYTRVFHHDKAAPPVIVNAPEIDFALGDADYGRAVDNLPE